MATAGADSERTDVGPDAAGRLVTIERLLGAAFVPRPKTATAAPVSDHPHVEAPGRRRSFAADVVAGGLDPAVCRAGAA